MADGVMVMVSVCHVGVGVTSFELVFISVAVTVRVSLFKTVVTTFDPRHKIGTSVDSVCTTVV